MSDLESLDKLSRDLRKASISLGPHEARFLVDAYYMIQEDRKRTFNQDRQLEKSSEPHEIISWLATQNKHLEKQIAAALDTFSAAHEEGQWARRQVGIGPIIAAGLLAHIDLAKTTTATKLWRFSGFDPSLKWEKGQKRPWNASLKVLGYKIGESFVKTCNHKESYYGPIYSKAKAMYTERNAAGLYTARSADILKARKFGAETEARKHYEGGHFPPAHIHAMARRYAIKLFLSHYLEVAQRVHGIDPSTPYAIAILGHHDYIPPPP